MITPLFLTSHLPFGGIKVCTRSIIASHSSPNSCAIADVAITFLAKDKFVEFVGTSRVLIVKVIVLSSS